MAIDVDKNHVLRFNNVSGVWSDAMGDYSARQWDDNGNALLDLEQAHWVDYKFTFNYFVFNSCGMRIVPETIHQGGWPDPDHYAEARRKYYDDKIRNFELPSAG